MNKGGQNYTYQIKERPEPPPPMPRRLEKLTELSADEAAEIFRIVDEKGPGATEEPRATPGALPRAEMQGFAGVHHEPDPVYERSPERAVESLRRYTADCSWVVSVEYVGRGLIEVFLIRWVKSELLRRLPNFVNGYRVAAYDEESRARGAYIKIGDDLDPRRVTERRQIRTSADVSKREPEREPKREPEPV